MTASTVWMGSVRVPLIPSMDHGPLGCLSPSGQ